MILQSYNSLKSLMKAESENFFINDFNKLKLFFLGLARLGTALASIDGVRDGADPGNGLENRIPQPFQRVERLSVAKVATNAKGLKSLGFKK
jgi:hypothetical protein